MRPHASSIAHARYAAPFRIARDKDPSEVVATRGCRFFQNRAPGLSCPGVGQQDGNSAVRDAAAECFLAFLAACDISIGKLKEKGARILRSERLKNSDIWKRPNWRAILALRSFAHHCSPQNLQNFVVNFTICATSWPVKSFARRGHLVERPPPARPCIPSGAQVTKVKSNRARPNCSLLQPHV